MSIPAINEPWIVIPVQYSWTSGRMPFETPLFGPENEFESTKFRLSSIRLIKSRMPTRVYEDTFYLELISCQMPQVVVCFKIEYNKTTFASNQYINFEIGNVDTIGLQTIAKIDCQLIIQYPYKPADKQLATDLETLRINPLFTDVTFVVGSKEFPAHRNILSVRSPVFQTMLKQTNFIENQSNRIEVIDIESNLLEALLEFVYTSEVKELFELAADLLVAAHKYQIDSLVKQCESSMKNSISIENASKYLTLADMYSLEELKTKALKYINANTKEVMQTEGWKILLEDNFPLMKELYKNLALGKE